MNQNRIWTDGEGLSWSTITGSETPEVSLKLLTLDLTDALRGKQRECEALEKQLKEVSKQMTFLRNNLAGCVSFGEKRLGYDETLRYVHDQEKKVITVSSDGTGNVTVTEEDLTI